MPARHAAAQGFPQLGLGGWLLHQLFQAGHRQSPTEPPASPFTIAGVGIHFPGPTPRRTPPRPTATASGPALSPAPTGAHAAAAAGTAPAGAQGTLVD